MDKKINPGKEICENLRMIRKKICEMNNIDIEIRDCPNENQTYCKGTCVYCDYEKELIEEALEARKKRGEEIILQDVAKDDYEKALEKSNFYTQLHEINEIAVTKEFPKFRVLDGITVE